MNILVQALVDAYFHFSWLYYTQEWNYKVIFGASLLAQTIRSASNAGDPGLIPGSGRSLGEGNGNPLQCFCLGNPMDILPGWSLAGYIHGLQESDMSENTMLYFSDLSAVCFFFFLAFHRIRTFHPPPPPLSSVS